MEQKYECACGHMWSSKEYSEDEEGQVDYFNGAECPECGSDNVGEPGWKTQV